MAESTKTIYDLKHAANYAKLAMHKEGPRSFKKGQGALLKVIYKFGDGTLDKDKAKKTLGWRGCDVRMVAKKAADNKYITIADPKDGFVMTLTDMGKEVVEKRLDAEDKAADALLSGLTDEEKKQLSALCEKISKTAEGMGVDYSRIQKRRGRRHGNDCQRRKASSRHAGKHGHKHTHHHELPCCESHEGHDERCCHHMHGHGGKYVFILD